MLRKIHIVATVLFLLPLFVSFGISNSVGSENKEPLDNYPMIRVCPHNITGVDVGETVTISVILSTDVENLYGFDIASKWDPTILEYISHVVMAPVESYSEGVLHGPTFSLKDEVEPSAGTYWVACSSMSSAEPFSGNGVFFTITFEVLSISNEQPLQLVSIALSDDEGQPIDHQDPEESAPEASNQPYRPPRKQQLRRHYGEVLWWLTQLDEMRAHVRASEYSNTGAWQP